MKPLVQMTAPELFLVALNGASKGDTYKLVAGRVTIGRGQENDISLRDDVKVSRNHAVITITNRGAEISDVSDKNKVIVNGEQVTTAFLAPGAIIQLGETKLQFKINSTSQARTNNQLGRAGPTSIKKASGNRARFYTIVGIVALIFVWLLNTTTDKKPEIPLRTEEAFKIDINANKKIVADSKAEKQQLGHNTKQYEEAQPNFVRGFRDYRKGQYDRAIEYFQACLSLFPNHIQCKRYLVLSQKKFSELVQYHMVLANKYKSQNQFNACMAAYRNVMIMVKNPNDKIWTEAKAGYDACQALAGERF
ncbi:MAG: hypothetical protein A2Z20_03850 [Bdellovibrionales bacterium RBG_16_40_8]|nr:MAG: hypothetical protein A2Z20_03850 [Bdellovibrionales bacterium RBG_16_40_8]